jgi:hypothetical protein
MGTQHISEFIAANIHVLNQGAQLVKSLDDQTYCHTVFGARSGIGVHLRHALDFYQLFLDGIAAGTVDYDRRSRDKRVEQDRVVALDLIDDIVARLRAIADLDAPLRVKVDIANDAANPDAYAASTIKRELQALVGHTIHHYALITYALKAQGREPDAGFGYAPSTLDYFQKQQQG